MTVGQSSGAFTSAMNDFVTQYNALVSSVTTLTGYNATTKQAGLLSGNASVLGIMSKIKSTLNSSVTGITGSNSAATPRRLHVDRADRIDIQQGWFAGTRCFQA